MVVGIVLHRLVGERRRALFRRVQLRRAVLARTDEHQFASNVRELQAILRRGFEGRSSLGSRKRVDDAFGAVVGDDIGVTRTIRSQGNAGSVSRLSNNSADHV